jgi:hypothetical protein
MDPLRCVDPGASWCVVFGAVPLDRGHVVKLVSRKPGAVHNKVEAGQADRIVLNLGGQNQMTGRASTVDLSALRQQFREWPIEGLRQVIVIKDGKIFELWP